MNLLGSLTISGIPITGNTSGFFGAAIDSNLATLSVSGSTISGKTANFGNGRGIFGDSSTVTISATAISSNTAMYSGGGSSATGETSRSPADRFPATPSARAWGSTGAEILNYGTMTVNGSSVSGNSGGGFGGDIGNIGTLTISDSALSGNSATYDGGGTSNGFGTLRSPTTFCPATPPASTAAAFTTTIPAR